MRKKILILSTGDTNGAYEVMCKIASILIKDGHFVKMLVKEKIKKENYIVKYNKTTKNSYFDRIISKFFSKPKKRETQSLKEYSFESYDESSTNLDIKQVIRQIGFTPDYTFVGMTPDFANSTDLLNLYKTTNTSIYNITVDMNHFTGGCHFAWDCNKFTTSCDQNCPALISGKERASENFKLKFKNAKDANFKIIAGSGWTLDQAKRSAIYSSQHIIYNINSVIDMKILNNSKRHIAKDIFDFDSKKKHILIGSQNLTNVRKGFRYFIDSLVDLESELNNKEIENTVIVVVSRSIQEELKNICFEVKTVDFIKDYRLLSLLYQAVDIYVNSSIEDSGPMMVSEAMACGTPVVGFDMGVVHNMVITGVNGYKAVNKDSRDLSNGIKQILRLSPVEFLRYSTNATKKAKNESSFEFVSKIFSEILNE